MTDKSGYFSLFERNADIIERNLLKGRSLSIDIGKVLYF